MGSGQFAAGSLESLPTDGCQLIGLSTQNSAFRAENMRQQIRRLEQLIAWQKARELTKHIYLLTATERYSRDFGLRDQIQRASSIDHVQYRGGI